MPDLTRPALGQHHLYVLGLPVHSSRPQLPEQKCSSRHYRLTDYYGSTVRIDPLKVGCMNLTIWIGRSTLLKVQIALFGFKLLLTVKFTRGIILSVADS